MSILSCRLVGAEARISMPLLSGGEKMLGHVVLALSLLARLNSAASAHGVIVLGETATGQIVTSIASDLPASDASARALQKCIAANGHSCRVIGDFARSCVVVAATHSQPAKWVIGHGNVPAATEASLTRCAGLGLGQCFTTGFGCDYGETEIDQSDRWHPSRPDEVGPGLFVSPARNR